MHPTLIEIYPLADGRYGWTIEYPPPTVSRCEGAGTVVEALEMVLEIIKGETT